MEETTKKNNQFSKQKGGFKKIWENLKSEFGRITWSAQEALVKRTVAVVASTVGLGVIIAVIDMLVKFGLGFIIS